MKKYDTLTCGIFYCRESAEINGCGSLQTSSWFGGDALEIGNKNIPPSVSGNALRAEKRGQRPLPFLIAHNSGC